jgi:hypothetical protein
MHKKKVLAVAGILLALVIAFTFIFLPKSLTGWAVFNSPLDGSGTNDTYIRSGVTEDNNYGSSTTLRVGNVSSTTEYRSLIMFDLSSIGPENTVTLAKLQVYHDSNYGSEEVTVKAYRLAVGWDEFEVTWKNRTGTLFWTSPGSQYLEEVDSVDFPASSGGYYNFSIESAVRGWVNGSYVNYGLVLIAENADEGNYTYFGSSESAVESQRPYLTVEYAENAPPSVIDISNNAIPSQPKLVGQDVSFTVSWIDLEGDDSQIYVCNSSNISVDYGCGDTTFCSTFLSSTNPVSCSYNVLDSDSKNTSFWLAVCDIGNCSNINSGNFYINHAPNILVTNPNGGQTVNQSLGNYIIEFNSSDADSDELFADIYYGNSEGSLEYLIVSSVNLSENCSDIDANPVTQNPCTYSWNSTDVYGTYYLSIVVNDSFTVSNDSSDSSFNVRSLIDNENPRINSTWIDSDIYSGKVINLYANVTEENIDSVWVSINNSFQNYTMFNDSSLTYNVTWTAVNQGVYSYKIYANDTVGNVNNTMPWQSFTIRVPNVSAQNEFAPGSALPYTVIRVSAELNASDAVKNIYAYLNTPEGFIFLSNYSQNVFLGNFSDNETKEVVWFVSVPITESAYTLNITYSDLYSNSWQSDDFNVIVTSDIGGGYSLSVDGYPEVETSNNYYVEAKFSNAGVYTNADSMLISIYDSIGNLVAGPASMTQEGTGVYNYTYAVGGSVNEGQWETIVNATRSATSYYANSFFKIVGGPFDVRSINVLDADISSLNISVVAENTGGADKDLFLYWNLTREDTGEVLDSGLETFMVSENSERTWFVSPITDYVGQVRITFLGYYSGTEKAGAYDIFSTTSNQTPPIQPPGGSPGGSGPGGGGPAATTNLTKEKSESLEIIAQRIIYLSENIEKNVTVRVKNTGGKSLANLKLILENLSPKIYTISPSKINELSKNSEAEFIITFNVNDVPEEIDFNYVVEFDSGVKAEPAKIVILSLRDYFLKVLENLRRKSESLQEKGVEQKKLNKCNEIIDSLESNVNKEEYLLAGENANSAKDCLDQLEPEKTGVVPSISIGPYVIGAGFFILLIVIIIAVVIVYTIYKKLSIINFMKQEVPKNVSSSLQKSNFDEEVKRIEDSLND